MIIVISKESGEVTGWGRWAEHVTKPVSKDEHWEITHLSEDDLAKLYGTYR